MRKLTRHALASLAPTLESFLCSMVELGGVLAFHHCTGLAFFVIFCVMRVWHMGLSPEQPKKRPTVDV